MSTLIVNSKWENFPANASFTFFHEYEKYKCTITVHHDGDSTSYHFACANFFAKKSFVFTKVWEGRKYPGCVYHEAIKALEYRLDPKNKRLFTHNYGCVQLSLFA